MKSNAIRLYKHYSEMVKNPKGMDTQERANVRTTAQKAKADMEFKFKTSPKYIDDPEIQALLKPAPVAVKKKVKKEEVK